MGRRSGSFFSCVSSFVGGLWVWRLECKVGMVRCEGRGYDLRVSLERVCVRVGGNFKGILKVVGGVVKF